jgi:ceramide glucosyltransferase
MALGSLAIAVLAVLAGAYQLFAIAACLAFLRHKTVANPNPPPVSILKPVRGLDPRFHEAIASHMRLEGEFELLAGLRDSTDPAASVLRTFEKVRMVPVHTQTPNGKVGALVDLAAAAKHDMLIASDADILVEPDYLRRVTGPLSDPRVGLVTCLYRPEGDTLPAKFEGLGISTDFAPSTLVARFVGVDEFAMGSTLVFRKRELERIGGFAPIGEFLADDYQLGHRIHQLGMKCVLSDVIVETHMGGTWIEVWKHQVRWARTIRISKFWGYLGLPITFATFWALMLVAFGFPLGALTLLSLRLSMAAVAGGCVIRSRDSLWMLPLVPLRDLFGAAVWIAGLLGRTVEWRGVTLQLQPGGRIR